MVITMNGTTIAERREREGAEGIRLADQQCAGKGAWKASHAADDDDDEGIDQHLSMQARTDGHDRRRETACEARKSGAHAKHQS